MTHRPHPPEGALCVALDLGSREEALRLRRAVGDRVRWWKVGSTLFTREGPRIVGDLAESGASVFLDLKFHDIPHQVAGAVRSAAEIGASLCTVHAKGGVAMLTAAREAAPALPLVAIVRLTSEDADPKRTLEEATALDALGVDGIVASAEEAPYLRGTLHDGFWIVTPGIRPASGGDGAAADDQRRVSTPAEAAEAGSSLLVVGRPITRAADPLAACESILEEIARCRTS